MADEYSIEGATLANIADAIREKTGESGGMTPLEMPAQIASISTASTQYIIGTPVDFELAGWDPDLQGATCQLTCKGYKVGANGLQVGLPEGGSTVNMLRVIFAALTIVDVAEHEPDPEDGTPGEVVVTLSAVNPPTGDLTIALFGLEAIT